MIKAYSFGKIEIDRVTHTADVMIYPDGRVQDSWWRKAGHQLCLEDIEDLIVAGPEVIVVGTGTPGLMVPDPGLEEALAGKGIALEVLPTQQACDRYNKIAGTCRAAACLHLTC